MHGKRGAKCQLCPKLKVSTNFKSTFTGLTYTIRHRLTCKSQYCVYLVTCVKCLSQYCGSTKDHMHIRHNGHRQEIREEGTPLGRHFAKCGYDNLAVQIIDCIKTDSSEEKKMEALRYLEGVWQTRLGCFAAQGNLNVKDEMRRHKGKPNCGITNILNM